jgi:hypothetical protein
MRTLLYHHGVDHGVGTYVTNYIIGAVGVASAIFLLLKRSDFACPLTAAFQQAFIGIGFVIAGVGHQVYPNDETDEWTAILAGQCAVVTLGYAFLVAYAHNLAAEAWKSYPICTPARIALLFIVTLGAAAGLTAASVVKNTLQFILLFSLLALVFALIIGIGSKNVWLVAYVIVTLSGLAVAVALVGKCSKEDDSECPLTEDFNHNAVYHVIQVIALGVFHAHVVQLGRVNIEG